MNYRSAWALFLFSALLFCADTASAQSTPEYAGPIGAENEITAIYADVAPRIDGILDEALWIRTPIAGPFVQLDPA